MPMSTDFTLREPLVAEILDRLLLIVCPLVVLFIALGLVLGERFGVHWPAGLSLTVLGAGLLVALLRRRLPAPARVVAYSLCFAAAGVAAAFAQGVPGDALLWDNRCLVHAATGGYEGHRRLLHRITVGERAAG